MNDEKFAKDALNRIGDIEPSAGFESGVMGKITGEARRDRPAVGWGWRFLPVPAMAVLLLAAAIVGGNFVNAYAGKLKEYGASKLVSDMAKGSFPVSLSAVKRYCANLKKRGAMALLGPAHISCIMDECGETVQACAAACNENGASCSVMGEKQ